MEAQAAPYTIFMGKILPIHSYVDLTLVGGSPGGQGVEFCTDLNTCYSSVQGCHRGGCFFPDGSQVPFFYAVYNFELRAPEPQMVEL